MIPKVVLDPENDEQMIANAQAVIQASSDNRITDFRSGSVTAALVEGQVYITSELLWYLNQLPEALALEVFRLAGVERSPGTTAKGLLAFLLTETPLIQDFYIPSGYVFNFEGNQYKLTENLVIPKGQYEGQVSAESVEPGSVYNVPAFGLSLSSTGFVGLQSVYNPEPFSGGSDLETLDNLIARSQQVMRHREVMVSRADYEDKAVELLGGGKATAIPLLTGNRVTEETGHVHVFLSDTLGQPPNPQTCSNIRSELQRLSFIGASVWVSPINLQYVNIELVLRVNQITQELADVIADNIQAYLSPTNYTLGSSLRYKELEFIVRSIPGIKETTSVLINREATNVAMVNSYTNPTLDLLTISLVDDLGTSQTYYYGTTIGDPL